MTNLITIHVVFHAHLDPLWLWPWTAGLDEVLATSRSACDRLDAHPDLFFTQGEAWSFAQVEHVDPSLFHRIRRHIDDRRWEVVNGWWTQPDCNFPSIDGLRRQLSTGLSYIFDRFGLRPRCGFNPDAFGHCAVLPDILREFGQDRYVFMRPQEHELTLPARLFSWRSHPQAAGVTAFRIANSYNNGLNGMQVETIARALDDMPTGCTHALTLAGLGNHGGGPTDQMVRWVRENRYIIPGARLEFSTIDRFFNALDGTSMPVVTGELQQHAIGCYTVARNIKVPLRRAEHMLARAEESLAISGDKLDAAWRVVCSHHFHDTVGGTLSPEAFLAVENQIAGICALADEALAFAVRKVTARLPPDQLPRVVLANPGTSDFRGWHEANVYVEGPWKGSWGLRDDSGKSVPFQFLHNRLGVEPDWHRGLRRILLHADIPAGAMLTLRMDPLLSETVIRSDFETHEPRAWGGITLALVEDPSDTWGHGRDRFGPIAEVANVCMPVQVDHGPLMSSLLGDGTIGKSRFTYEWRSYHGLAYRDLHVTVHWCDRNRVLKLLMPLSGESSRVDGTPGMPLERLNDGRELPVHDWSIHANASVVCPDVWAIDATPEVARFTLLRSPHLAHHDPAPMHFPRALVADQGVHSFRFRFYDHAMDPSILCTDARAWHRPPVLVECTQGMPLRFGLGVCRR